MRTLIYNQQYHKFNTTRKLYSTNISKIIQYFQCWILINYFYKLNVYCAKSSDIDSIEKSVENLKITENKGLIENEPDKTTGKNLKQKKKNSSEKLSLVLSAAQLPSTSETDGISSNISQMESKMISIIKNHDIILKITIPKILKDFYELKDHYSKIREKIEEFKGKFQSSSSAIIKKVKKKVKESEKHYLTFVSYIDEITLEARIVMSILQKGHARYQMMKIELSSDLLKKVDENEIRLISGLDDKGTKLLEYLLVIQFKLVEDLNEALSILMILSKFIEMKPENFKANKEIRNAILSLK